MAKEEEMSMQDKMEEAMKTWDGTWKWMFYGEDYQTGGIEELGWYDTKEEAIGKLVNLANKIDNEHPNCKVRIICNGKIASIDVFKSEWDIDIYELRVGERRSCFEYL